MEKVCMICGGTTTRLDKRENRARWFVNRNRLGKELGYLCSKCYDKTRRTVGILFDFKESLRHRKCSNCGSSKTLVTLQSEKYSHKRWYKDGKGGWWCNKCHHLIRFTPEIRRGWNSRRISPKGRDNKTYTLKENPRKGICSWCKMKNGEKFVRSNGKIGTIITHMHHEYYDDKDPLEGAVEICNRCHGRETRRLERDRY